MMRKNLRHFNTASGISECVSEYVSEYVYEYVYDRL